MEIEILPPEEMDGGKEKAKSGNKEKRKPKLRFIDPCTRREFRGRERWAYQLVQKLEEIAYWCIPSYREGICMKPGNRMMGHLTGYHQFCLIGVRQVWDRFKEDDKTAQYVELLKLQGVFSMLAFNEFLSTIEVDRSQGESRDSSSTQITVNLNKRSQS
jgi:hypothetical protein